MKPQRRPINIELAGQLLLLLLLACVEQSLFFPPIVFWYEKQWKEKWAACFYWTAVGGNLCDSIASQTHKHTGAIVFASPMADTVREQ